MMDTRERNRHRGKTLVELMVVILIVAILAAAAIPTMRGRIDAAKWSEGKAMMGTIATVIRAYAVERNVDINAETEQTLTPTKLGFLPGDLKGTYFDEGDFRWVVNYDAETNSLAFTIIANRPAAGGISSPYGWSLNERGKWTELTAGP